MFRPARTRLCNEVVGRRGECWQIRANKWGFHPFLSIYPRFSPFRQAARVRKGKKSHRRSNKKERSRRNFQVRTSVQTRQSGFYWCEVEPSRSAGVCALAPMGVGARVPSLCGQLMTPNQAFRAQRNRGQEMDFSFVCEYENSMWSSREVKDLDQRKTSEKI